MKIGIFGTGMVGQILAAALVAKGYSVMIGTRDVAKSLATTKSSGMGLPAFGVWHKDHHDVLVGTFSEAAAFGEVLLNATGGNVSLEVLHSVDAAYLDGKVLMDLANDLEYTPGASPRVRIADTAGSSVGEQIQAAFPKVKVVKTLNTLSAFVMVDPKSVAGGDSTVFVNGNDAEAKNVVKGILEGLGWTDIMDLGDITSSRAVELLLPVWLKAWAVIGNTPFNFKIVR